MVGLDDGPRSRAQLVLVGAVAIAFIILGIVVVFNTVLFTENVDSTQSGASVDASGAMERQITKNIAILTRKANAGNQSDSDLKAVLSEQVTNYSRLLMETKAQSSSATVSVEYNNTSSVYGARVFDTSGEFTRNGTQQNWELATESNPAKIARFQMNVSRSSLIADWEDSYHVAVLGRDAGGDYRWRVIRFYRSPTDNLIVNVSTVTNPTKSTAGSYQWQDEIQNSNEACDVPVGSDVTIDMSNGTVEGTSCEFDFTDGIEPLGSDDGYALWFRDGDNATGHYSVHLSNDDAVDGSGVEQVTSPSGTGDPGAYYTEVVWGANVTVEYKSPTISYHDSYTIPVYNTSR